MKNNEVKNRVQSAGRVEAAARHTGAKISLTAYGDVLIGFVISGDLFALLTNGGPVDTPFVAS